MATAATTNSPRAELPPVPAKRYFTIGEVADLCLVKQHVLRYWEQEFTQLKPMKRRGNRRYYQHHEVMLIRRIRSLLYDEGFTISGARVKLDAVRAREPSVVDDANAFHETNAPQTPDTEIVPRSLKTLPASISPNAPAQIANLRRELLSIRALLT